ncbi:Spo0E family sporulation regulatory protein-aspartic acid phosphatase [Biomaibacter acetigenes]|uniref:Spo0E family sporulation regulatory protein-aspartic acid phosphatase n=2 Tax=Biomaibacter acetigenes TaxID=2316383 RepID=A0A3G2R4N6_9FIRM|nr:Spo0E family sporulation regulatory protein-aspartic acid phosphatase [Biomaibacter acetigenes]RKL63097.1 aspartyl-phosphate phosphatase Spo0E family protein [Thermoanaerobacteraceae bacterium SP2]
MTHMTRSLSHEINKLKIELYETLDLEKTLNGHRAYLLSLKLDKLIYEYYTGLSKRVQKNVEANMNY